MQWGISSTFLSSSHVFDSAAALLKELEACNQEELLQEDLRIKDGNVGSPADKGVGCVGQGMDDIVSN